jgi:hypothetical protein
VSTGASSLSGTSPPVRQTMFTDEIDYNFTL